jgi:Txe/YoeB family toxin of Txe-Axe toxin-antitoxin module
MLYKLEPLKGLKKLKPLKSLQKLEPLKPLDKDKWSTTPLSLFLAGES